MPIGQSLSFLPRDGTWRDMSCFLSDGSRRPPEITFDTLFLPRSCSVMRSKAPKRPLSSGSTSAGEPDEDDRSKKKVRWDPKSDDEMGTAVASDDFEMTCEEHSTMSNNEKVHRFLHHRIGSDLTFPGHV